LNFTRSKVLLILAVDQIYFSAVDKKFFYFILIFGSRSKVYINFDTISKVLKATNTIIRTFNLVIKVVGTDFGTLSKVLIMMFLALKTFDLVKKVASSFWH